jgi:4-hydroxy-2-oxoheptanedioate aldolase
LLIVVQIEGAAAIEHLDELLAIEEPDVFFIGPTDLSASMGLKGQKTDQVAALIGDTLSRIVAAGRTAGILASSPAEVETYRELGARYLLLNGESLVQWGARLALEALTNQDAR